MSKEIWLLLGALGVILISIFFWNQSRNCYTIEYENPQGSQTAQICKGQNGNE